MLNGVLEQKSRDPPPSHTPVLGSIPQDSVISGQFILAFVEGYEQVDSNTLKNRSFILQLDGNSGDVLDTIFYSAAPL